MSQTLSIKNFSNNNITATTRLTADYAAGISSVSVQSTGDFIAGTVLIGAPGSAYAELVTIPGQTLGQTLSLSAATKFPHNNGDPVYMLFGNQIKVYSAADTYGTGQQPPDTSFSQITGSPFAIDGSSTDTTVTDSNGAAGTWYKYTYYNAALPGETALADANAAQAGQVHYTSLDDIREAAGFTNSPNVTDDRIAKHRAAAENEVIGRLLPVYQFPLPQPINPLISTVVKNIAAGTLMHELYMSVAPQMAAEGEGKANAARHGGGSFTSLDELADRDVVLVDANFAEQTLDEIHGVGGWPDNTTSSVHSSDGGDHGHQFKIDEVY